MKKTESYLTSSLIPRALKSRLKLIQTCADQEALHMYIVGGFVRDLLLRKVVWDMDIISLEDPSNILSTLPGKITRHARYMTHTVAMSDGSHIDFAVTRKETYPGPAALPVVSPGNLTDDLKRRDFTCNAVAIQLHGAQYGTLVDYFQGKEALLNKQLKIFHDKSFIDDPTRIYRAARFMGRYNFKLEKNTERMLQKALLDHMPARLSIPRLSNEFIKIISETNPQPALKLLRDWNALRFIHPKISSLDWKKISLPSRTLNVSLAWFLQDLSPELAEQILTDLCIERKVIDTVTSILSAARVLISKRSIHDNMLEELRNELIYNIDFIKNIPGISTSVVSKLKNYRASKTAFLNGADLHALGYVPGRYFGEILRSLRREIWDGRVKKRQDAVSFVKRTFKKV
ncbi:MAG: hypothetical protein ABII23_00010 [bacterium]